MKENVFMALTYVCLKNTYRGDLEAGMDNERIGLKGSPTKVKKTFTPEVKTSGVKINEPTSEEGAEKLFAILCEDKVF